MPAFRWCRAAACYRQRRMGTGGRAAVDGAMATGVMEMLLKAGIGFDCALRIVNSALIAKSGDESLATVDVAMFDLFSGKRNCARQAPR